MTAGFAFTQVDVFTDRPLLGTPCRRPWPDALDEARMQAFAQWTNLSETAFLLTPADPGADYRVRIFTPVAELPFAGHPTLGSCHAWLERGGVPKTAGRVVQECGVGLVNLRLEPGRSAFEAPPLRVGDVEAGLLAEVLRAVGLTPGDVVAAQWLDNGPRWLGLLLHDAAAVLALEPIMRRCTASPRWVSSGPSPDRNAPSSAGVRRHGRIAEDRHRQLNPGFAEG